MDEQALLVRGMGYVPGIAQGVLQRGDPLSVTGIALITQAQIETLTQLPAGLIVIDGAPFSHTMIALLGFGIPTVIVRREDVETLRDGLALVIDGRRGTIHTATGVAGTPPHISPPRAGQCVMTADGISVELRASVRSVDGTRKAHTLGATSIGLVRTEFFESGDGSPPDSTYYLREFASLCAAAAPLPVTFRLLDIATDKLPSWLHLQPALTGALGMQGVRAFGQPAVAKVVRAQLTAIDQLSRRYQVGILLPYLVRHEELQHWITCVRTQLPPDIPIGAMVETPAGAFDLERWFDLADFIAVGCNDVMQCLFAADRDLAELHPYLDPYAPLLYRFFHALAQRAGDRVAQLQLCGLLPQLDGVLPVLLGLGYRIFSVDAVQIPYLAESIRCTTRDAAEHLAQAVCAAEDTHAVRELLNLPAAGCQPYVASNEL